MLKRFPRLGALLGVLLLISVSIPARPALATTITVDGDPSDWPVNATLIDDNVNEDAYVAGLDIDNVYFTNNPTRLFGRTDTLTPPAETAWDQFPTMQICFDTISGGAPSNGAARCRFAGMDFRLELQGLGSGTVTAALYSCPNVFCSNFITSSGLNVATTSNVTEFAIDLSLLGIVSPGGTYQAFIVFDNNGSPPDDFVLDGPARFPLVVPGPSPVTLTSLSATRSGDGVKIAWETASEVGIQGFHVLRSATGERVDAARITSAIIPGSGNSVTGARYSFSDATATVGSKYTYWLEVINNDGSPEAYGPVAYRPGVADGFGVYLPVVRR